MSGARRVDAIVAVANGRVMGYETTEEYAKRCNVRPGTVRVWERRGKIKTIHIGRDRWIKASTPKPEPLKRRSRYANLIEIEEVDLNG